MKPCAFEYFNPQSVEEAIELLDRYGDEGKIIAGGQSLVPMMNFRLARPEILIDINGIKELEYIKTETDELVIGALTRERDIEQSPLVVEKWPILSKGISFIGHSAIRNRGTIGGSLVHADPSAEIPTSLYALNGNVKVVGPSGEKILEPEEFFMTYLTTSLEPSDLLVEVRIPALPEKMGWSFGELSRRSGDFAIVAVGILLFTKPTCSFRHFSQDVLKLLECGSLTQIVGSAICFLQKRQGCAAKRESQWAVSPRPLFAQKKLKRY
ncbi:hypothetical protein LCGC14_2037310 [marine sediment metagenome]|uniref:FAD-binding PCMH-type domain-containing protein n=1 Tax=marine sediment metagenome TaxID=412755 RepID=A0A0F9FFJ1_9ZZZZ